MLEPRVVLRVGLTRQTTATSLLGAYWFVAAVTIGVTAKLSVGGGEGISHSSPFAPHGFGRRLGTP